MPDCHLPLWLHLAAAAVFALSMYDLWGKNALFRLADNRECSIPVPSGHPGTGLLPESQPPT